MAQPDDLLEQQDLAQAGGAPQREGDVDGSARQPQPLGGVWTRSMDGWGVDARWMKAIQQNPDKVLTLEGYTADLSLFENMLDDDVAMSAFQQRRLDVIARPWIVEPGADDARSKAAADHLRDQLKSIRWDDICEKMLFARWFGYGVGEVIWEIGADGLLRIGNVYIPDRKWFGFRPDGTMVLRNPEAGGEGEPVPERKFWVARGGQHHDALHYGVGLAHWCYWPIYFKKNAIKFWALFLEKFGMPTLLGKFPPGWESEPEKINKLLAALSGVGTDSAVATPNDAEVTALEATRSGSGASSYAEFIDCMDNALTRVILSQTMTTEAGPAGLGSGQAEVHERKGLSIAQADSDLLHEGFNNGVAEWLTQWNFPGAATPLVYRKLTDDEDVDAIAERDTKLDALGWVRTEESFREVYGDGYERKPEPVTPPALLGLQPGANDNPAQPPQLAAARRRQLAFAAEFASRDQAEPLYISRKLENAAELLRWARSQGFTNLQPADELHATVLYCETPVDWFDLASRTEGWGWDSVTSSGGPRKVGPLGDDGLIVLHFTEHALEWRHKALIEAGASHGHAQFWPHVTFAVDASGVADLDAVEPFTGELRFGPEIWERLDNGGELTLNVPAVEFAAEQLDAVDRIVAAMAADGTRAISAMVRPIREAVAGMTSASDPEALRFALLEALEKMPTDKFQQVLADPLLAVRAAEESGLGADSVS